MNKRTILVVSLFVFLMIMPMVLGVDIITQILKPFAGINVGALYNNPAYAPFIDAVIYFMFFIGLTTKILGKQKQFSGMVSVVFGIILGLSATFAEYKMGFRLFEAFGPVVMLIVLAFLWYLIFSLVKGFGGKAWGAACLSYVVLYSLFTLALSKLNIAVEKLGLLYASMSFMFIVSIVVTIIWIAGLLKTGKNPFAGGNNGDRGGNIFSPSGGGDSVSRDEGKMLERVNKMQGAQMQLEAGEQQLQNYETQLNKQELSNYTNLKNLLLSLQQDINILNSVVKSYNDAMNMVKKGQGQQYTAEVQSFIQKYRQTMAKIADIVRRIQTILPTIRKELIDEWNKKNQELMLTENEWKGINEEYSNIMKFFDMNSKNPAIASYGQSISKQMSDIKKEIDERMNVEQRIRQLIQDETNNNTAEYNTFANLIKNINEKVFYAAINNVSDLLRMAESSLNRENEKIKLGQDLTKFSADEKTKLSGIKSQLSSVMQKNQEIVKKEDALKKKADEIPIMRIQHGSDIVP